MSKWGSGKLQKILLKIYEICKQAEYAHFYRWFMSSVYRPSFLRSPLHTPHTHSQRLVCCGRSINIKLINPQVPLPPFLLDHPLPTAGSIWRRSRVSRSWTVGPSALGGWSCTSRSAERPISQLRVLSKVYKVPLIHPSTFYWTALSPSGTHLPIKQISL